MRSRDLVDMPHDSADLWSGEAAGHSVSFAGQDIERESSEWDQKLCEFPMPRRKTCFYYCVQLKIVMVVDSGGHYL
jgi:hypothetical protein